MLSTIVNFKGAITIHFESFYFISGINKVTQGYKGSIASRDSITGIPSNILKKGFSFRKLSSSTGNVIHEPVGTWL